MAPGLVTERFIVRPADNFPVNRHIKSIVRLHRVEAVGPDPHHFKVQGGTFGESGQEIAGPLSCTAIRCCASTITIRNPGRNACAGLPAAMPTARRAARGVRPVPGHGYRGPVYLALSPALKARMKPRDEPTSVWPGASHPRPSRLPPSSPNWIPTRRRSGFFGP